jgi:hypothetical protein
MHWPPPWHANTKLKAPNTFNSYVKALANLTQMHDKKKCKWIEPNKGYIFFIQFPCFLLLPLNTKKKKKKKLNPNSHT